VKDPRDSPNYSESSEAGGDIALGQEYVIWWWCLIVRNVLEPYRVKLPPQEYYQRLNALQAEFSNLTSELDKTSDQLRKDMEAKVASVVAAKFKN